MGNVAVAWEPVGVDELYELDGSQTEPEEQGAEEPAVVPHEGPEEPAVVPHEGPEEPAVVPHEGPEEPDVVPHE
jgi:hypothetical protein